MGWIKDIWKDVKEAVGIPSSSGGSSSPAETAQLMPRQQAEIKVQVEYKAKRIQYWQSQGAPNKGANSAFKRAQDDLVAFMKTPEYEQLVISVMGQVQSGNSINGNTVTDIVGTALSSVLTSASDGLQQGIKDGLQTAVSGGINTIAENMGVNPKAATVQETVGNFAIGALTSGATNWLKRNWYWLLIPGGLIFYFLFRGLPLSKAKPRAKSKPIRRGR